NMKVGDYISFNGNYEDIMEIRNMNVRYLVCTRKFNKKLDKIHIDYLLETGAYFSRKSAIQDLKDDYVYTCVDLRFGIMSTVDQVLNCYEFGSDESMRKLLLDLTNGVIGLSRRNM